MPRKDSWDLSGMSEQLSVNYIVYFAIVTNNPVSFTLSLTSKPRDICSLSGPWSHEVITLHVNAYMIMLCVEGSVSKADFLSPLVLVT